MVHLVQYSIIILFLLSSHTRGVESIRKCAFQLPASSSSSVRRPRAVLVPIPKAAADRSLRLTVRGGSPPNTPIDSTTENDSSSSSSSSSSSFALWQELLAELFGTFLIVQMGTASMMAARFLHAPAAGAYIPLVWAAAVALAIAVTAPISGAHLNPAITLALSLVRPRHCNKNGWSAAKKVLLYTAAQFAGAILASATNLLLFGPAMRQYELAHGLVRSSIQALPTASVFGEYYSISIRHACAVEIWGTALLSSVIFALTHPRRRSDAAAFSPAPWIGATVGVVICTLSPFTQAGLNPARDLGPRLVAYWGGWTALATQPRGFWVVYGVGPLVGALMGALFVDRVLYRNTTTRRSKKS